MAAPPLSPLIVILGPTASGKTDFAVELAMTYGGEIVNADSRQVYKEIDVASAKPTLTPNTFSQTAYQGVPHHLFDIVRPDEEFNVTHYKRRAIKTIRDILARDKIPFLVGGTGLWISAVVDNYDFPEVPPNNDLRQELVHTSLVRANGRPPCRSFGEAGSPLPTEQLFQDLIAKDPDAARFVNPRNRRRIIRALEVIHATGNPFSAQRAKGPPLFRSLQLGITRPIAALEERIEKRIQAQMEEGLEQEARALFSKYDPRLPALSSISVREWKGYFDGKQTLQETEKLIYLHNRQYAKRQMTWFKKDTRIQWIENKKEALSLIRSFLQLSSRAETPGSRNKQFIDRFFFFCFVWIPVFTGMTWETKS